VLFDDDLSPTQLKNLEKELNTGKDDLKLRIYDRSLLILDIFLSRAQTAQARTQVELAMNQYLLPRLTRMWTHLKDSAEEPEPVVELVKRKLKPTEETFDSGFRF
jgi:GTPases